MTNKGQLIYFQNILFSKLFLSGKKIRKMFEQKHSAQLTTGLYNSVLFGNIAVGGHSIIFSLNNIYFNLITTFKGQNNIWKGFD